MKSTYRKNGNCLTISDEWNNLSFEIQSGHFEHKITGQHYYSMFGSYDAKLDVNTGDFRRITSPEYNDFPHPTINELLASEILIDKNYGKQIS